MPSKFVPKPDKSAAAFVKSGIKKIRDSGKKAGVEKEEIDKEVRKFRKIYLTVLYHAIKKLNYERDEAEEYALNTYIDKAEKWSAVKSAQKNEVRKVRLPIMIESLDLSDEDIIGLVETMQKNINIISVK
jgi:hypothetical protein